MDQGSRIKHTLHFPIVRNYLQNVRCGDTIECIKLYKIQGAWGISLRSRYQIFMSNQETYKILRRLSMFLGTRFTFLDSPHCTYHSYHLPFV